MNINLLKTPGGGELIWSMNQDGLYFAKKCEGSHVSVAIPLKYLEKLTIPQIGVIAERCILRLREDLLAATEQSSLNSSSSTPT